MFGLFLFRIRSGDISALGQELLASLFSVLEKPSSKENEYVMKGITNIAQHLAIAIAISYMFT